jgi:hypothetical protein
VALMEFTETAVTEQMAPLMQMDLQVQLTLDQVVVEQVTGLQEVWVAQE